MPVAATTVSQGSPYARTLLGGPFSYEHLADPHLHGVTGLTVASAKVMAVARYETTGCRLATQTAIMAAAGDPSSAVGELHWKYAPDRLRIAVPGPLRV